jgi:low affinity Fe/Cu permease
MLDMRHHTDVPWFTMLARRIAMATGHPLACGLAGIVVLLWLLSGPLFGYSDTWQLVINTATTVVTFLMVFLLQHSQNHDTQAIHLKLDELIRSVDGAHNILLDAENASPREMDELKRRYARVAEQAKQAVSHGEPDTTTPRV